MSSVSVAFYFWSCFCLCGGDAQHTLPFPACNPLRSSPLGDLARLLNPRQAAGLEVVAEVMDSQCLLIVGKDTKHREMVDLIVRRIEGYITAEK